jgi:RNA-binding protein
MLTSKQRAQLRGLANNLETIFQVGKGGINDNLIQQVSDALEARELIKLRVLESSLMTAREACTEICEAVGADPVQCVGSRFVIYKESTKNKQIKLVK